MLLARTFIILINPVRIEIWFLLLPFGHIIGFTPPSHSTVFIFPPTVRINLINEINKNNKEINKQTMSTP